MRINELALRLDITPRAIRLYEQKGLLKPERRLDNGYRSYSEQDGWRLQTIASLREIGLGLQQIQDILEKWDQGDSTEVQHYLEIQRMAMVSRWVELKQSISQIDKLISRSEENHGLQLSDLFLLTDQLKQLKQHAHWQDKWGFDRLADEYDQASAQMAAGDYLTNQEYETTLAFMTQWIAPQPGEHGLDIGTGTGNLAANLLTTGSSIYAIDQSNEMLTRCRAKLPNLTTKLGNALSIPHLIAWLHNHEFITVSHQINEWVRVVYAIRKN